MMSSFRLQIFAARFKPSMLAARCSVNRLMEGGFWQKILGNRGCRRCRSGVPTAEGFGDEDLAATKSLGNEGMAAAGQQ